MLPRILKATIKGLFYFFILYVVPSFLISQMSETAPGLFSSLTGLVNLFVIVIVFFVVASELTSGTIFQHAFNVGKAIILIVFFVLALGGGVVTLDVERIHLFADLRVVLGMLIVIDLLSLAKSVLQAVNFLLDRAERQLPTPKPAG